MSLKKLDVRIDDELRECGLPEPAEIAAQLVLSRPERASLLAWALTLRVEERIRVLRWRQRVTLPGRGGSQVVHERTRSLSSKDEARFDQQRQAIDARFRAKVDRIVSDYSARVQAEGIRIGLEQANVDRVYVHGRRILLADCTVDDLRELAATYKGRADGNLEQGGYYLAIAEKMEAHGFHTVREMCNAEATPRAA